MWIVKWEEEEEDENKIYIYMEKEAHLAREKKISFTFPARHSIK